MHVELSPAEHQLLTERLQRVIGKPREEIHRAETYDYKRALMAPGVTGRRHREAGRHAGDLTRRGRTERGYDTAVSPEGASARAAWVRRPSGGR